ncbi:MAG TPA: hypothetical protein VGR73_06230 [Bryobacteraceae bacterium]|nr:hypothetical protein [Bryobacteraceae bacterium]
MRISPYLALAGLLLTAALLPAQTQPIAQAPSVDVLDFFGLNKIPQAAIRKVLGFKEGDPFPSSKGDVEERLDQQPDVVESHLEAVCCDAGKTVLYVGIEEKGAIHFDLREPPEGAAELPREILSGYRDFLDAYAAAVRRDALAEDLTRGHSLMTDPLAREIQLKFPGLAKENLLRLRGVLRNSSDDEQRAAAAYVVAYAPDKRVIVDDLQFALRDADPAVRANAVRGLMAIAVYARLNPDLAIRIEPTWFIEMLNSLSWSDRDHALKALQILTDKRDASTMSQLRERALPALVEMSRWKTLAHALPAFVLTGRVAGLTDQQIEDAWTKGDRESVIAAAAGGKKR